MIEIITIALVGTGLAILYDELAKKHKPVKVKVRSRSRDNRRDNFK